MEILKKIFLFASISITPVIYLSSCVSAKTADKLAKIALQPSSGNPRDTAKAWESEISLHPEIRSWRDSLVRNHALRDTFITMSDGSKLHAMYVKAGKTTKGLTAIVVHGYTSSSIGVAHIARMYNRDLGFNVLIPDLRNSGLSSGNHYTMGWDDRLDLVQWAKVAEKIFKSPSEPTIKIALHGVSMGAASVMMLYGEREKIPTCIRWFIADCGYTSAIKEFSHVLKTEYHVNGGLRRAILIKAACRSARRMFGVNLREVSAKKSVKRNGNTLPLLIIHGTADTYVPTKMGVELYNACSSPDKELWLVPNARHAESYALQPEKYTLTTKRFIQKYSK